MAFLSHGGPLSITWASATHAGTNGTAPAAGFSGTMRMILGGSWDSSTLYTSLIQMKIHEHVFFTGGECGVIELSVKVAVCYLRLGLEDLCVLLLSHSHRHPLLVRSFAFTLPRTGRTIRANPRPHLGTHPWLVLPVTRAAAWWEHCFAASIDVSSSSEKDMAINGSPCHFLTLSEDLSSLWRLASVGLLPSVGALPSPATCAALVGASKIQAAGPGTHPSSGPPCSLCEHRALKVRWWQHLWPPHGSF